MATYTIVSTSEDQVKTYELNGITTWGELKNAISGDFRMNNMKAMLRSNRTTLERVDAQIPSGDQKIYLTPAKVKSGAQLSTEERHKLYKIITLIDEVLGGTEETAVAPAASSLQDAQESPEEAAKRLELQEARDFLGGIAEVEEEDEDDDFEDDDAF